MPRNRHGMTLIEIMVSLLAFTAVFGGAMSLLTTQQRVFRKGNDDLLLAQNLGYGLTGLAQEIRTAGLNVPSGQPVVVYAGPFTFGFNADLVTNVENNPYAVYYDPDAPAGAVTAMRAASKITVPGSSPSRSWPLVDYNDESGFASPAEVVFYNFRADAETSRSDDYILVRQVNALPAELVSRNLLAPTGGVPFFSYQYLQVPDSGRSVLASVPSSWMPLYYGSTKTRNDSVRVVRVAYRVTNGFTGPSERIRDVQFSIGLPNIGLSPIRQCGATPLYTGALQAVWDAGDLGVRLTFPSSVDEGGGERDVGRYVVYRRLASTTSWGDPYLSIPGGGQTEYGYLDRVVVAGQTYTYGVAAQDCTPRSSTPLVATVSIPSS
ncbi:MAG: prepilin-type N-terminal cleavage/methylation domain-containing protein [Actinomycetota bacterium]|nr:prepilin-type N-terminal cleavage/methylation domain-containing protein [Actinomycetota bacterium]